jgi:hypothetical protein
VRRWLLLGSALLITTAGVGGNAWAAAAPSGSAPAPRSVVNHGSFTTGSKQFVRLAPQSASPRAQALTAPHATLNYSTLPPTAQINVTYVGFSAQAKTAFQAAVNIWQTQIHSKVPINVVAHWSSLAQYGPDVLGAAGPTEFVENFPNAPRQNVLYPIALANAIAGSDQLPAVSCSADPTNVQASGAEIDADFNSDQAAWYYGTDGKPAFDQIDLESVVLHELGHGLGFVGTNDVPGDPTTGVGTSGLSNDGQNLTIFDTFATDGAGHPLDATYPSGTLALGNALRGADGGVRWSGPAGAAAAGGGLNRPALYSPADFQEGSSFSHLSENAYLAGNPNALMTPAVAYGEVEHSPGPIMLGMFKDMGWPQANVGTGDYHAVTPVRLVSKQVVTNSQALDVAVVAPDRVPAGATAGLVTVTLEAPTKVGIWSTLPGCSTTAPTDSQNFQPRQTRTMQQIVPLDVSGHIRIPLAASPTGVISGIVSVDLVGWFGGAGDSYHQLPAKQAFAGTLTSTPVDVQISGVAGVPASGVTAVVLTAGEGFGVTPGFLFVGPGGTNSTVPTVGYTYAELTQGLAIVPLGSGAGAGKIRVRVNTGRALAVLNVIGWYGPSKTGGLAFHSAGPIRLPGGPHGQDVTIGGLPASTPVLLDVHTGAPSATATMSAAPGGTTAFVAVQEVKAGQPTSGSIIVMTNPSGQVRLRLSAGSTNFYTDYQGWFSS